MASSMFKVMPVLLPVEDAKEALCRLSLRSSRGGNGDVSGLFSGRLLVDMLKVSVLGVFGTVDEFEEMEEALVLTEDVVSVVSVDVSSNDFTCASAQGLSLSGSLSLTKYPPMMLLLL